MPNHLLVGVTLKQQTSLRRLQGLKGRTGLKVTTGSIPSSALTLNGELLSLNGEILILDNT